MIKSLLLLLVLFSFALGWTDGGGFRNGGWGQRPRSEDVIVTPISTFTVPSATQMLGMDYCENDGNLVVSDNATSTIRGFVPGSGTEVWNMSIPFEGIYGVCQTGGAGVDATWYATSWSTSDMYKWDPEKKGWSIAFDNPAGSYGRGLDFDENTNQIWEVDSVYGFYQIDETGASTQHILDYALGWLGGIALFPYGDELGIVVTYYDFYFFAFYSFDGTDLTFLGEGSIEIPNFTDSYGISYDPSSDTFFWAYKVYGDGYKVTEFSYEFQTTSLNRDTWAGIKASF